MGSIPIHFEEVAREKEDPIRRLGDLLGVLFTADELREFVRASFPELEANLPRTETTISGFAHEVVWQMERRGRIDRKFFDWLALARPLLVQSRIGGAYMVRYWPKNRAKPK